MVGKTETDLDKTILQEDLNILVNWAEKLQMEYNMKRCKLMHVGKNNKGLQLYMGKERLLERGERLKDYNKRLSKNSESMY